MGNDSESPDDLWTKTLGSIGRDYKLCELCSCPCGKATWGHAFCSKDYENCSILWFFKDLIVQKVLEIIKQDWKHLVLVEIEGLKDPSASKGYARWRDLAVSVMPCVGVKSPQTVEEPIKRKRVNNEKELRRQVEKTSDRVEQKQKIQGNVGRNDAGRG
jgi:hypothetical protein